MQVLCQNDIKPEIYSLPTDVDWVMMHSTWSWGMLLKRNEENISIESILSNLVLKVDMNRVRSPHVE